MELESPLQQAEGALLHAAQKASGRTIRLVAHEAGISEARWRQIVKGVMHVQGVPVQVIAPAHTLARMARVVGVTPDQLHEAGRADAAYAMTTLADPPTGKRPEKPDTSRASRRAQSLDSEIDMIYASTSMTAQQKLDAIRMVLHLQAEVAAESAAAGEAETASAFTVTPATSSAQAEEN